MFTYWSFRAQSLTCVDQIRKSQTRKQLKAPLLELVHYLLGILGLVTLCDVWRDVK